MEAQEYAVTVRQPRTQDDPTGSSRKFHARGLLQKAPLHVPIVMNPPATHRIWPLNGIRRWRKGAESTSHPQLRQRRASSHRLWTARPNMS